MCLFAHEHLDSIANRHKPLAYGQGRHLEIIKIRRLESESFDDIEVDLEGKVFHVTKQAYWPNIVGSGEIRANKDGSLSTTFGSSHNSYFRNRNCVSVFDYRAPSDETIRDFRSRCYPFQAAEPGSEGIVILVLSPSIHHKLIPWTRCKEENAQSEIVVPYIEAGFPGTISLDHIDMAIFLRREEDPSCWMCIMRQSSKE